MEKIVDVIAPKNTFDLLLKVLALIISFTAFDYFADRATQSITGESVSIELIITLLVAAPFGFFVMGVMAVQRRLKERLKKIAETDQLTGLANRQAFLEISHRKLSEQPSSTVLMIDVDHFKAVNDEYGHSVGDFSLCRVGKHLTDNTRAGDVVGRLGGEEFAVLLVNADKATALTVSTRICQPININDIEDLDGNAISFDLSMSVGGVIALPGQNLTELIRNADNALYSAKSTGRARTVFYKQELRHHENGAVACEPISF
ncbi:GGDEF domain-containing protein [Limimaricola cinnabarinus]|uniref:GGDEF domain-containing protein n=1 Tax=Limimaricola cinnabarinus TaxID=1125964 RepID=UPI00130E2A2A|nr:GGDEF domain-containing protein [Limimaricola cinnabarinus]